MSGRYAITGANGNLGVRSIGTLGADHVRALVRSNRAKKDLLKKFPGLDVRIVDYTDATSLRGALEDCDVVVHLVGIIKETKFSSYVDAHERSCEALVASLPNTIRSIVYLSIIGSETHSKNTCLASKGRAESILMAASVDVTILQVPMVLGEGDYASAALNRNASKTRVLTFRATSLEQPIYAGDVIAAIIAGSQLGATVRYRLGGPESLSRRALIERAAGLKGNDVTVISLPVGFGLMLAWVFEWLANPPVTRAMLGVLDHDDKIDSEQAIDALGISLTPLDTMLANIAT